jgi:hypothetical protein
MYSNSLQLRSILGDARWKGDNEAIFSRMEDSERSILGLGQYGNAFLRFVQRGYRLHPERSAIWELAKNVILVVHVRGLLPFGRASLAKIGLAGLSNFEHPVFRWNILRIGRLIALLLRERRELQPAIDLAREPASR